MGFTVDEVSARGAYTLQLDVTDKAKYMTPQSHRFDFRTDYCLRRFDAETEKAFLKQDIDNVLGEEDIHLFYEYEECSKTMGVYAFDSVSFKYLNPPLGERNDQIDHELKRFTVT